MERIPNALIIPLIVNHFSPFGDFSKRLVLFVKTKMTANINVDTEPKTKVAKYGLGISDNPILIIGCIIPRAKEAPNGKSNTHTGQVLIKLFVYVRVVTVPVHNTTRRSFRFASNHCKFVFRN